MFKIKSVEIDGFWNTFNLKSELNNDVNIFIGRNGTGKTTFINMLEAALTADLDLLESLQFSEIRLFLTNRRKTRRLIITKTPKTPYDLLVFKIGNNTFELPLLAKEIEYRKRRIHPKFIDNYNALKESLNKIVNISWLSVHRELLEDEYREQFQRRPASEKNPIDRRIDDLTKRFTSYQLQLQSEINKISDRFRKEVLTSVLYSDRFDTYSSQPENLDLRAVKDGLVRTYTDLGVLDHEISNRIEKHVDSIRRSLEALSAFQNDKKSLSVNDVLPLSLLNRTQHIVELSTATEEEKKDVLEPVNKYLNILRAFINDKSFNMNPNLTGELLVSKGDMILPLEQLSSGEKQLFILLTEALLQRHQPYIFIADEPELSLHIEWQRRLLSQIRTLNTNSQIIVATHSPEIAGKWRHNIINMKDIIHD